jgi:uncharacterized protein with FMN-binding domain
MRRALTGVATAAALALPTTAGAATIARKRPHHKAKKRVLTVKKKVAGIRGDAGQWGQVEVTLIVRKTTTIVGTRKTVRRQIVGISVPVYPDHTNRSVFISQQALPMLQQEVLQAQFDLNINMISGATFTSNGFLQSLQSALMRAERV